MEGWNSDLDGGLWWVEWKGLRFRIEMTEKGWKAICSFSDGMDCAAGVEEAAGYLGTFALLAQAREACRRHARRALTGRYRAVKKEGL